jgi:glucose/arabinose dehydrogenase
MFSRRAVLGGVAGGAAFTLLADRADAAPAVGETLARGLVVPWGLAFLPNGDALVTERESGDVVRVSRRGGRSLVGNIPSAGGASGEGGLLGVTVSPTFTTDRNVYFYVTTASDNRILRARYEAGALTDLSPVLSGIPAATTHTGGRLSFGPDGRLYAGTGDARQPELAQDENSLAGKILRIDPDGAVPADNPFGNAVWTLGHRNVQGMTWDRTGRMLATEFGEHDRDELNVIVGGDNYGWPIVEGGDGPGPFHDPFVMWRPTSTCSPSGVAARGGRAWVAALRGEALYAVTLFGPGAGRRTRYFHDRLGRVRTVELAPDGSLWVMTSNRDGRGHPRKGDDKVVRIVL